MENSGKIFISYRRSDTEGYAGRIFDRLKSHFGRNKIFMDVDTIQPGENFIEAIEDAVSSCEVLIALIGDEWLKITDEYGNFRLNTPNDFVKVEITTALKRGIRVIPVLLAGVSMPKARELPNELVSLTERNALEIRHGSFDADVDKLLVAIEKVFTRIAQEDKSTFQKFPLWAWFGIPGLIIIIIVLIFLGMKIGQTSKNQPEKPDIFVSADSQEEVISTNFPIETKSGFEETEKTQSASANSQPVSITDIQETQTQTPMFPDFTPTLTPENLVLSATPTNTAIKTPTPTLDIPYGQMIFEPMNRIIEHILPDPGVRMNYAGGIWQLDFIAEATFHNPYSNTVGPWDIGFMFRDMGKQDDTGLEQLRLVISSDGIWYLMDYIGNSLTDTDQGEVTNLDTSEGGKNHLIFNSRWKGWQLLPKWRQNR